MVNRKIFFDIFFYNRENPSRELMEMAESLWRTYMMKYGLGLDAGAAIEPTYEEVREITIMANYAVEMVEKQIAEAEAEEARRKQAARDAWERSVVAAVEKPAEEPAEEASKEAQEETEEAAAEGAAGEAPKEVIEEAAEELPDEITEEAIDEVTEEVTEEAAAEETVPEIPEAGKAPAGTAAAPCALRLWVEDLTRWCRSKGMQCILTMDEGDCYLHVYLPHKKKVYPVGTWCFKANTNGADLAAEMTKLYAYCTGFADCFEELVK